MFIVGSTFVCEPSHLFCNKNVFIIVSIEHQKCYIVYSQYMYVYKPLMCARSLQYYAIRPHHYTIIEAYTLIQPILFFFSSISSWQKRNDCFRLKISWHLFFFFLVYWPVVASIGCLHQMCRCFFWRKNSEHIII